MAADAADRKASHRKACRKYYEAYVPLCCRQPDFQCTETLQQKEQGGVEGKGTDTECYAVS